MIKWNTTKEEREIIEMIVSRATRVHSLDALTLTMDITACHKNGNELDLEKFLDGDSFDFYHDIFGISKSMNRRTGKIDNNFLPRFTKQQKENETEVTKPICSLIGQDGNIFNLVELVRTTLKRAGQLEKSKEMTDRVFASGSYDEALQIITEYVEVR